MRAYLYVLYERRCVVDWGVIIIGIHPVRLVLMQ